MEDNLFSSSNSKKSKNLKKGVFSGFRKLSLMFSSGTISNPRRNSKPASVVEYAKNRRVVFLGTGDSGKTTLAHQLIYRMQSKSALSQHPEILRSRIVHSVLCEAMEVIAKLLKNDPTDSKLLDLKNRARELRKLNGSKDFNEFMSLILELVSLPDFDSTLSGEYLNTRQARPRRLKILGDKLAKLSPEERRDWVPDIDTLLLCVNSTNGITSTPALYEEGKVEFVDAGGHKSERAKWFSIWESLEEGDLEDANVLVYTVSAADLNAMMFETKDRLRFDDSLKEFKKLMRNLSVENAPLKKVMLVFTKNDLIGEQLNDETAREYLSSKGFCPTAQDNIEESFKAWIEQQFLKEAESLLKVKGPQYVSTTFLNVFDGTSVDELWNEIQNELL